MKISVKSDYALKFLIDLSTHGQNASLHIQDIAERQKVPLKFLQSIVLVLKRAGFVDSKKGPGGGYHLTQKPAEITVRAVLQQVEGNFDLIRYESSESDSENGKTQVVLAELWSELSTNIIQTLEKITIADLVKNRNQLNQNTMYYI